MFDDVLEPRLEFKHMNQRASGCRIAPRRRVGPFHGIQWEKRDAARALTLQISDRRSGVFGALHDDVVDMVAEYGFHRALVFRRCFDQIAYRGNDAGRLGPRGLLGLHHCPDAVRKSFVGIA